MATTLVHLARGHETVDAGGATVVYRHRKRYAVDDAVAQAWRGMGLLLPLQDVPEEPQGATDAAVAKMVKGNTAEELEVMAAGMGIATASLAGTGRDGKVVQADIARAILAKEAEAARNASLRPQVPEVQTHGPTRVLPAFPAAPRMTYENDGGVCLYIRNGSAEDVTLTILRTGDGESWTVVLPAGGYTVLPTLAPPVWNAFNRGMDCGVEFSATEGVTVAALRLS